MMKLGLRHFLIAAAAVLILGTATADARPGGGSSFGSRGGRTFSMPAPTPTAPTPAAPIGRSYSQPSPTASGQRPYYPSPPVASPLGGFGRGLLMGLIGGGLIGLLSGSGIGSIFSLILQIGLIVLLVRLAMSFFARRAAMAGGGPGYARSSLGSMGMGSGGSDGSPGAAPRSDTPLAIGAGDYADFERLLGEIQAAYGREDRAALHRIATPEMASYFEEELAGNASQGVVNKVSGAKLLKGDLSEAWHEADADYATVAMRYALLDMVVERSTGRIVAGDPVKPDIVTEVWTFRRPRGGPWQLSAIQQVR
jgi:predicted lipid-binding transport protein (Tim44 family)